MAYHSSNMGGLLADPRGRGERTRTVGDLASDQVEEEDTQRQVEPAETHEGEEHGAGVDRGTGPLGGPEQTVDEPRLTTQLGGHPADGVRNVRERERDHENPQHGPVALEPAQPREQSRDESNRSEDGPDPGHDVEGVVEQLDIVGPDI